MSTAALRLVFALACAAALPAAAQAPSPAQSPSAAPVSRWFKGNTHTHTLNSDGDSTPEEVARWYREHGYDFLVLSDHNYLTSVDGLNATIGAPGKFLLIPGEEVTDVFDKKPVHVNGLDVKSLVLPQHGDTVADTIQRNVDAIRAARGVPHVNHPNYVWAVDAEALKQVRNLKLFEIYNGHDKSNNVGAGGFPGLEAMWDDILTSGQLLYGIAVDDAHHFKKIGERNYATPGHAWIMVRATSLDATSILGAMERGEFYATTGVVLQDYAVDDTKMTVTVARQGHTTFTVDFVGAGGRVLASTFANPAVYTFRGDEVYVRARVADSNGWLAWTQPLMRGASSGAGTNQGMSK